MRQHTALTFCAAALALACQHSLPTGGELPPPHPPQPENWTLVWSDEFSGPAGSGVDTTRWNYNIGDGCPTICGWGNNEKEYYSSDTANIQLNGQGQLAITARVAPLGMSCYYGTCRYTSAKLDSRNKVTVQPGKVEARIKLAPGQGLWPAFWMLGTADV
jgi:beta-glucanase (GH16 family)